MAQAIIANSRKVFLAADHSKFGRNAMVRLAHLSDIDAFFTDNDPPETMIDALSNVDIEIHVAD